MTIKITESQIKRDAKKIKTLPSLRSVRALKFKKKRDYNKFVNWIGSSSQALKKATPDKKEIKKIGLGVGGFFGGGGGDQGGKGPGLIGSLLVGVNAAKGLSYGLNIPLIGVNHLEGHLLAIFLQKNIEFPFISLVVSGGHTDLYRVDNFGKYKILGRTRDDAAGESFDKVAKMLGFKYPGGPKIEKIAKDGNSTAHKFPRAYLGNGSLDFSFSGLKTSVKTFIQDREEGKTINLSDNDIAAGFQESVVEVLANKIIKACEKENLTRVVVTGGVAANGALRKTVESACNNASYEAYFPDPVYCTDNAAMIACAGYHRYKNFPDSKANLLNLDATASSTLGLNL